MTFHFNAFKKKIPIEPLPHTLANGTRTVEVRTIEDGKVVGWRWTLVSDYAVLRGNAEYVGDWRCEGRKSTSFVRYSIVDWDQVRASVAPYVDPKTGITIRKVEG